MKIIRWVILGALTAGFLYAGVTKLLGQQNSLFVSWGFPAWFTYVVGAIQVFGAIGLYYRATVKISLTMLTIVMLSANLTLAGKHMFIPDLILPLAYLLGLFALMYLKAKRPEAEEGRWGLL